MLHLRGWLPAERSETSDTNSDSSPLSRDSWEGFVIENLLAAAPARIQPSFYRTADGAEIDTVMEL